MDQKQIRMFRQYQPGSCIQVSKTLNRGGLEVICFQGRNLALQAWLWRFPLKQDSYGPKLVKSIHDLSPNGWDSKMAAKESFKSPLKGIQKILSCFSQQVKIEIGKGDKTRFQSDVWHRDQVLKDRYPLFTHFYKERGASLHVHFRLWKQHQLESVFYKESLDVVGRTTGFLLTVQGVSLNPTKVDHRRQRQQIEPFHWRLFSVSQSIENHGRQISPTNCFGGLWCLQKFVLLSGKLGAGKSTHQTDCTENQYVSSLSSSLADVRW